MGVKQRRNRVTGSSSNTDAASQPRSNNNTDHLGAWLLPTNMKNTGESSSSTLPPVVKMSPYMFYHGDPREENISFNDPNESSSFNVGALPSIKGGKRGSNAGTNASSQAPPSKGQSAADIPIGSPFRNSDLGDAIFATNQHFTHGKSSAALVDLTQRQLFHQRLRDPRSGGGGGLDDARSSNLVRLHRVIVGRIMKEAGRSLVKLNRQQQERQQGGGGGGSNNINAMGSDNLASSMSLRKTRSGAGSSTTTHPGSPFGVDSSSPDYSITNGGGEMDGAALGTAEGNAAYLAKAASEVRVALILDILREEYNIHNPVLLDALRSGLQRTNDRLREGSPISAVSSSPSSSSATAAGAGTICFSTFMELIDLYVNGQPSIDTRHACFDVFDTTRCRVVTLKHLRSLRGLSDDKLLTRTDGGTFAMLKVLLDTFQQSEELTTTLTKEQVLPMFDVDEGRLVEGFLEEVIRQIVVHEYGVARQTLL